MFFHRKMFLKWIGNWKSLAMKWNPATRVLKKLKRMLKEYHSDFALVHITFG
jgi:hypothetical protein